MTDRLQTADEVKDLRLTADGVAGLDRRRLILTFSLFYAELLQEFDDGLHVCIRNGNSGFPIFPWEPMGMGIDKVYFENGSGNHYTIG